MKRIQTLISTVERRKATIFSEKEEGQNHECQIFIFSTKFTLTFTKFWRVGYTSRLLSHKKTSVVGKRGRGNNEE